MKLRRKARKLIGRSPLIQAIQNDATLRLHKRALHKRARNDASNVTVRLDDIVRRWPQMIGSSTARPIFIFAAGWRSGSTLVQRMLTSVDDIMIWGEPYSRSQIVGTLLNQFRSITMQWPLDRYAADTFEGPLDDQWIANLYPSFQHLLEAHRSFFTELFETPARAMGRPRWGFKEVRLLSEHALYLKLLFPRAKFIFLYRDPIQSYLSFRNRYNADFVAWPNQPIATPGEFGAMWSTMLADFLANHQAVDAMLLKYEDLLSDPSVHQRLCDYVGAPIRPVEEFAVIVGRNARRNGSASPHRHVQSGELFMLNRKVGRMRARLGYE